MRASKIDHSLAALERAADRAHVAPFAKANVSQSTKSPIASAFNHCEEAASDLERFLAHAAADAKDHELHRVLYDAATLVAELPFSLRSALASVDAFVEIGGTTRGALQRAALGARAALSGPDDAVLLDAVERAFLRALSVYDEALEEITKAPAGFAQLLLEQRRVISHLHRDLARRSRSDEP